MTSSIGKGPVISSGGLRRFVDRRSPVAGAASPHLMERLSDGQRNAAEGESCEMCRTPIADEHSHVVDLEGRRLLCTCRSCFLLFTHEGAAQGRYRAVPDRYLYDAAFSLSEHQWDEIQIPVHMAFFLQNSADDTFAAFYPSPAGATESMLDLEAWNDVLAANPAMASVVPDVEGLLVRRSDDGGFECFLVPIDACYELVGIVRMQWKGFHGGDAVWAAINGFFKNLRRRSKVVERGDDGQATVAMRG